MENINKIEIRVNSKNSNVTIREMEEKDYKFIGKHSFSIDNGDITLVFEKINLEDTLNKMNPELLNRTISGLFHSI